MRSFIGIGTGRCGTKSLTNIIKACKNTRVSHEHFPSNWYAPGPNIGRLIIGMRSGKHPSFPTTGRSTLIGEVSCALLPHVQAIRDPVPDLRVICLHRNREDVVKSFMSWMVPSNLRPSDRVLRAEKFSGTNIPDVVERFPVIDAATPEQAWGFYWEMAEKLMEAVKEPVKHVWMNSLNDDYTLESIFDFLEIPSQDRVLCDRRVWNSSEENVRA